MALVSLHSVSIAFGGTLVLDAVSLDIQPGQRICLLGRNGAGKSTLLKILAGRVQPDSGDIIRAPGVAAAYLPQDVPDDLAGTVAHLVLAGAGECGTLLAELHRLQSAHGDMGRIHEIHHYLNEHDGWRAQTAAERAVKQVGLDGTLDYGALSGGMKRRVFLARALAQEPQLLLLDEPTNHLDIESIAWLESFLVGSAMTTLFITHDRRLLKRIATRIIELDRGKMVDWSCDYETFLARKQAVLDAEEREWERFDKKQALEEVWIRQGIRARRTRNEGRVRALLKMREQRRKRRERIGAVSMAISEASRSGERVVEAEQLGYTWNETPVIADFSITITRGDRIGVIGPNGAGKTTLLNLLTGRLAPQSGTVRYGTNVEISYFDQLRAVLDPEKSVWENVAPSGADTVYVNGRPRHIVAYLQDFLFTSERARSPVKQLSGGERNRLMLARLFTRPANVLVFDEPTNDLDAETLELLEELLSDYNGTVIVVSHDREFLNNVVTSTLVFEGRGVVKEYVGGYDDWVRQAPRPLPAPEPVKAEPNKPRPEQPDAPAAMKRLTFREERELGQIPGRIEQLESEAAQLNGRMADQQYFVKPGFVSDAVKRLGEIERELTWLYQRWEGLEARQGR